MSRDLAIEVQLLCIGLEIMLDKIVDLWYILPRHKTAHNTQKAETMADHTLGSAPAALLSFSVATIGVAPNLGAMDDHTVEASAVAGPLPCRFR